MKKLVLVRWDLDCGIDWDCGLWIVDVAVAVDVGRRSRELWLGRLVLGIIRGERKRGQGKEILDLDFRQHEF